MDSFTDDLNSPLPKQMVAEETTTRLPSSWVARNEFAAASTTSRAAVVLRPLAERLGRISLKSAAEANLQRPLCEDPFRQLSDDVVEHILARLPMFPLKAAKKVCKRWAALINNPQFEILHRELREQQPLLVCYGFNHLVRSKSRGFAYDVELDAWVSLPSLQFPVHNSGSLTGGSGVVYAISGPGEDRLWYKLTNSACSAESFGETWYAAPAMGFPRSAPVVSVALGPGIGHKVVVAGGVPEFEDEHMAVEVFDSAIGNWEYYGELPPEFADCNSRTWMSGAICNNKFYALVIHSWPIHVLDFCTREWETIQMERPEGLIYHHVMAIGTTLVVAGVCTDPGHAQYAVKLWKVDSISRRLMQIGLMPRQVFASLGSSPTVKFLMNENLVYVSMDDGELVVGEVSLEDCKTYWRGLPSLSALGCRFDSVVTFCASISNSSPTPT